MLVTAGGLGTIGIIEQRDNIQSTHSNGLVHEQSNTSKNHNTSQLNFKTDKQLSTMINSNHQTTYNSKIFSKSIDSKPEQQLVFSTNDDINQQTILKDMSAQDITKDWQPVEMQMQDVEVECDDPEKLVQELIRKNEVMVFSKSYCPFCTKVKDMMDDMHIEHAEVELDKMEDDHGRAMQLKL